MTTHSGIEGITKYPKKLGCPTFLTATLVSKKDLKILLGQSSPGLSCWSSNT